MGKCDLMWYDEREAAAPMFGQGMVCTKRTPTSDSFPAAGENKKISISWSSEILSLFPLAGVMDDFIAFILFSKQENGGAFLSSFDIPGTISFRTHLSSPGRRCCKDPWQSG